MKKEEWPHSVPGKGNTGLLAPQEACPPPGGIGQPSHPHEGTAFFFLLQNFKPATAGIR